MSPQRRAALGSVFAAVGLVALKLVTGLFTGSLGLLSEAAHSIADSCNQGLMLVSLSRSERPPDEAHPFGYGKERFFWTFLVAVVIFLAGATFSIGDGVLRLLGKDVVTGSLLGGGGATRYWIDYVVLGIALVAEGTSLARAYRQTRDAAREAGYGLIAFVRISKEPTTKMVLSEDAVAVAGVVIAFAGVGLQQLTGSDVYDASAAILVGLLLVYVAYALGRDIRGLLIGEAARPDQRETLRRTIEERPEVDGVIELLTMMVGPKSLLVAARVDLADDIDSARVETVSNEIDDALREAVPEVDQVFLDATPGSGRRR